MSKRPPTEAEQEHLQKVKAMKCMECRRLKQRQMTPTEVHHIRRYGGPRRHFMTFALCFWHHSDQSPNKNSLHNSHRAWIEREDRYHRETMYQLYGGNNEHE